MTQAIEFILSTIFPPRFEVIEEYRERYISSASDEHVGILLSGIGIVQHKPYRDAIERHWAEQC